MAAKSRATLALTLGLVHSPLTVLAAPTPSPTSEQDQGINQVHLAYGRQASAEMSVAWASNFSEPLAVSYLSTAGLSGTEVAFYHANGLQGTGDTVQVSTASDTLQYAIDDSPWNWPVIWGANWDDPPTWNGTFANYTSPWLHNTTLNGLDAETNYLYQIGNFPTVFNFTSGLAPGSFPKQSSSGSGDSSSSSSSDSSHEPFVVSVVGDIGQTTDSFLTRDHMMTDPNTQFTMIAGDVSYSDCDQTRWDSSGRMLEPLASMRPLMVGPGNHEIEYYPKTKKSFEAFENRFFMPASGPPVGMVGGAHFNQDDDEDATVTCTPSKYTGDYAFGNAFWSLDVGPLHVLSLNCYGPTTVGSNQYDWLESDLQSVDRSVTPFVVVQTHCPFYSTNKNHYNEWQALDMQATFEPLFLEYNVDLVLSGHVHAYQRSHPVYQGQAFYQSESGSRAPVYVVVGEGGNREGHAHGYVTPQPEWNAFTNDTSFGHGTVTVHNVTHMQWEWHVNAEPSWETQDSYWFFNPIGGGGATDDPAPDPSDTNDDDDDGSSGDNGKEHHHKNSTSTANTTWTILGFVLGVAVLLGAFSAAHKYGVFGNSGKSTKNSGAAGIEAAGTGAGGNSASNSNAYMYSSASAVEASEVDGEDTTAANPLHGGDGASGGGGYDANDPSLTEGLVN